MSQGYNIKSSFGFNVQPKSAQVGSTNNAQQIASEQSIGNLFGYVDNYLKENEKVFNGTVEHQIDVFSRQSMIIGMNLRNAEGPRRKLDVNT